MNAGRLVPRAPGESRVRRAVPVNAGKPAPRESPVPRALRELPVPRVPEGIRVPVDRQDLPAIPKVAYFLR